MLSARPSKRAGAMLKCFCKIKDSCPLRPEVEEELLGKMELLIGPRLKANGQCTTRNSCISLSHAGCSCRCRAAVHRVVARC